MPYEFVPIVFGLTLLFGILAYALVKKSLEDRRRLRLREMAHQERMKALEKEVPLMEVEGGSAMIDNGEPLANGRVGLLWLRLSALCLGLASLFGGLGMMIAFLLSWDRDMKEIWPIGFIPAMVGLGLLLFYLLSRGAMAEKNGQSPA